MSSHDIIVSKLNEAIKVENLFLDNESFMHNVPANSETQFLKPSRTCYSSTCTLRKIWRQF